MILTGRMRERDPLDIFIMAFYRVDKVGGRMEYGLQYWSNTIRRLLVYVALMKRDSDLQNVLLFSTLCFTQM